MSEAYLFGCAATTPLPAGIWPDWVEKVVWVGGAEMRGWMQAAGVAATTPGVALAEAPLTGMYGLQAAAREVMAGEQHLMVFGEGQNALVLGGPRAVGRYNLPPEARLALPFAFSGGTAEAALAYERALKRALMDAPELNLADGPAALRTAFAAERWLEDPVEGLSFRYGGAEACAPADRCAPRARRLAAALPVGGWGLLLAAFEETSGAAWTGLGLLIERL